MARERLWHRWLLLAASIVVGVGAAFVVLALLGVPSQLMDFLYLPGQPDVASADTVSFAVGVAGAVMVGWGTSMLYIYLDPAMLARPRIARAFFLATVAWFILDTFMSIAVGATFNALFNCLFLGLLLPPLAVLSSRSG